MPNSTKIPCPYGMTPAMHDAFIEACQQATICPPKFKSYPKIVQTIGKAVASAGYHAKDGILGGRPYCCAIDVSVKGFLGVGGYNEGQIRWFLFALARNGYAGWYRYRRPFQTNRHIHCIFTGHPMKIQLQKQVSDFLDDRSGLVGSAKEEFWTSPPEWDARLQARFLAANPGAHGVLR